MTKVALNLISGRTIQQGVAMEGGKEKDAYTKACGIIEMDSSDLKKLGAWRNTNVRVTSKHGSVVVTRTLVFRQAPSFLRSEESISMMPQALV